MELLVHSRIYKKVNVLSFGVVADRGPADQSTFFSSVKLRGQRGVGTLLSKKLAFPNNKTRNINQAGKLSIKIAKERILWRRLSF